MEGFVKNKLFCGFRGIFVLLFFILGVWIGGQRLVKAQIQPLNIITWEIPGFLWTDTFGWISLNCQNDWNQPPDQNINNDTNECNGPGGDYHVEIELNLDNGVGILRGDAWSPHLGLVCFGTTCNSVAPNGQPSTAGFDLDVLTPVNLAGGGTQNMMLVRGFARMEAHANEGGNGGWIDLSGSDGGAAEPRPPSAGGVAIQFTPIPNTDRVQVSLSGSAWQRNSNNTGAGWLYFGDPPPGNSTAGTGSGGGGSSIPTPREPAPVQETLCTDGTSCCLNGIDDDQDETSATKFLRRDCLDSDCKDQSFYSTTYNQVGGGHCGPLPINYQENGWSDNDCLDTIDNDFDGTTDCADADCQGVANCSSTGEELTEDVFNGCYNEIDDDGNGLTDCDDPKCATFSLCNDPCLCPDEGCPKPMIGQGEDPDQDGIKNTAGCDNCNLSNADQRDTNANGVGDVCDPVPWLQTKQGSLYIKQALTNKNNPPSPGQFTATYCIFANGSIGLLTSEQCPAQSQLAPVKEFRLKSVGDVVAFLSGKLRGRFDVKGLKEGKYGVVDHHVGDFTLEAVPPFGTGAQLILVENGNLTITQDLTYGPAAGQGLKQLPSVGFLVLGGDIIIDPNVEHLVGTFVTTGKFRTGASNKKLTVEGLVVAKQFDLARTYSSATEGPEGLYNDGRAVLNPPPGLKDLIKGLPQFRAVAPSQ